MDAKGFPVIGQIVQIVKGREAGQFAVIVSIIDDRLVCLADGDKRKFDQPKKKNVQHIKPTGEIANEVVDSIRDTGRVTNAKLRFCLNRFEDSWIPEPKKGE